MKTLLAAVAATALLWTLPAYGSGEHAHGDLQAQIDELRDRVGALEQMEIVIPEPDPEPEPEPDPDPEPAPESPFVTDGENITLAPGETIQDALGRVQPGDTLVVLSGEYGSGEGIDLPGDMTLRGTCGADGRPETIINGEVRIQGVSNVEVMCIEARGGHNGYEVDGPAHNITIRDFVTRDTRSSGVSVWGVPWRDTPDDYDWQGVTNFRLLGGQVINAVDGGANEKITIANGVDGCEIAGVELFNDRSVSYANGGEGIDLKIGVSNCRVHHNWIHDTGKIAIYFDAAGAIYNPEPPVSANNEIDHNLIENCNTGISISTEGSGFHRDLHVHHNLVRDCGKHGLLVYLHPKAGDWAPGGQTPGVFERVTLEHNVACDNGNDAIQNNPTAVDVVWRDNQLCDGLRVERSGPGFIDENNGPGVQVDLGTTGLEG